MELLLATNEFKSELYNFMLLMLLYVALKIGGMATLKNRIKSRLLALFVAVLLIKVI